MRKLNIGEKKLRGKVVGNKKENFKVKLFDKSNNIL